jgi:hypothetical protein
VKECVRYAVQQAGNPLAVFFQTAAAIISLVVVWPWHCQGTEPMLWEHLQRFVWTDDRVDEAMQLRDDASHTYNMTKVRWRAQCTMYNKRGSLIYSCSCATTRATRTT